MPREVATLEYGIWNMRLSLPQSVGNALMASSIRMSKEPVLEFRQSLNPTFDVLQGGAKRGRSCPSKQTGLAPPLLPTCGPAIAQKRGGQVKHVPRSYVAWGKPYLPKKLEAFYTCPMKRLLNLMLIMLLMVPIEVSLSSQASAAKTGSTCTKLNAKGWDGTVPIVCKKNSKGKLVWTKFNSGSVATNYVLTLQIAKIGDTLPSTDPDAAGYCDTGGSKYQDLNSSTGVEIRDGNGNLVATGVLGSATVIDVPGQRLSTCSFKSVYKVKKTDFYQVKIGTRFNQSYSFADLEMKNWEIGLSIISYSN